MSTLRLTAPGVGDSPYKSCVALGWCWRACYSSRFGPAGRRRTPFCAQTTPEANAVLPEPPGLVQLFFTEPIEKDYSKAELYDSAGNKVDTPDSRIGPDPNQLTLQLPANLARGTYTVVWRNISAADGHPQSGYLPFTIGSQADVVTPTRPSSRSSTPRRPG